MKKLSIMLLMPLILLDSGKGINSQIIKTPLKSTETETIQIISDDQVYDSRLGIALNSKIYKEAHLARALNDTETLEVYDGDWYLGKMSFATSLYELNEDFLTIDGYRTYVMFYRLCILPYSGTYHKFYDYSSYTDFASFNCEINDCTMDTAEGWENVSVCNVQPDTTVINTTYSEELTFSAGVDFGNTVGGEVSTDGIGITVEKSMGLSLGVSYTSGYSSEIPGIVYKNQSFLSGDTNQTISSYYDFNAATPIKSSSHMNSMVTLYGSVAFNIKKVENYYPRYQLYIGLDAGFKTIRNTYLNKKSSYFDKETTYSYSSKSGHEFHLMYLFSL